MNIWKQPAQKALALSEDEDLEPVVPESIPSVLLNYDDVLDKALTNNSFAQNIRPPASV